MLTNWLDLFAVKTKAPQRDAGLQLMADSLVDDLGLFDDDVFTGNVAVEAARAGLHLGDGVDHVRAGHDLAEDGVAPALRRGGGVVEEVVVHHVDEELRRGGVRIHRAGHGDRVAVVLKTVGGLVLDRRVRFLLVHAREETAALDHEARDDAVEDLAVVKAFSDIGFEVGGRERGAFMVELDVDDAHVGGEANHLFLQKPARGRRKRMADGAVKRPRPKRVPHCCTFPTRPKG